MRLFLVASDNREEEVRAQLQRPAFRRVADLELKYLPYGELGRNREAMGRFGQGSSPWKRWRAGWADDQWWEWNGRPGGYGKRTVRRFPASGRLSSTSKIRK